MKLQRLKRGLAAVLAAVLCVTSATAFAFASDTASSAKTSSAAPSASGSKGGTPPSGQAGGTPPSGSSSGQPGTPPSGGGGGGADTMTYDYSGTLSGALTADGAEKTSDGESVSADTADQNTALAENGGTLTITNGTLTKSGDDTNGDNCNFYGINSILLAVGDGTSANISDSTLTASGEGSNGIFATDGATVYASGDTISTTAGNSRGLDATYGGTIVADSMTITTQGDHCASIATDRGGGNISVTNSKLSTAGSGSPLLYSTGDIEVDNVTGTATGSQLAGMEGLNTIRIYNSTLESTLTGATASDPIADGVIIYQSTSGDAESTTGEAATFEAVNSTLKSAIQSGSMFYLTNTSANIVLSGTTLDFDSSKANLLTVQGNDSNNWGTAGSNGATVNFTALGETLNGNIDVDTISTLNLFLLNGTTYTGAVSVSTNATNTSPSDAPVTVNLDGTSKWIVTGDSTVTNLSAADGSAITDADGKTVTIVANGKTVVQGESEYTVTVTGSYTTTVTTSSVNELSTSFIDRTAFDSQYGVSTTFGTNGSSAVQQTSNVVSSSSSSSEAASASAAASSAASSSAQQTEQTETKSSGGSAVWYVVGAAAIVGAACLILRKKPKGKA
jgi:hypothetical protein